MNTLDVLLVLLAVAAASGGWRVGFVARSVSWLGMALGLLLAAKALPSLLRRLQDVDEITALAIVMGTLLSGAVVGQVLGFLLGARLRLAIGRGPLERLDRAGGAVAGVLGVAVAFWLLLPTMANTPEWPAQQARSSLLAGLVQDRFPEPPDTVLALRRLVGDDVFPQVLEGFGAAPDLGSAPPESGLDQATAQRVARSTVQVEAAACSRVQEGSGVVAADGLIVTNAHVVAGSRRTSVLRNPDGLSLPAAVVAFDPARDVAVLRVPDIDRPALPIAPGDPARGAIGAVFGHPRGGPLAVQPFQVGDVVKATGRDIYDGEQTKRNVLFLASALAPGDSGGPLVDPSGTVIGIAFAIAPDRPDVAYALAPSEVLPVLATAGTAAIPTGPCLG